MTIQSSIRQAALAVVFALLITHETYAFVPSNIPQSQTTQTTTSLNMNMFANAFKNDDSLGKAKNEGLSNGPKYNDQVTVNGKPVKNAVVDQKISQVCATARVKVPYNCQNGECGTCEVKINGRKARACVSKVPSGKCSITTN